MGIKHIMNLTVDTLKPEVNLPTYKIMLNDVGKYNLPQIISDYKKKYPETQKEYTHLTGWRSSYDTLSHEPRFFPFVDDMLHIIEGLHDDRISPGKNVRFGCAEFWAAIYERGDNAKRHFHYPLDWSICYYVDVEDDASPIILGNNNLRIIPKNGMMLAFPGWLNHSVPPTKGKRTIIVMNLKRIDY